MPRVSKIVAGIGAAAVCGVIALTVMCGYVKGLPVFELFTKGAAEGMHTAIKLLPTLLGLIVGISMLRASGFLELFSALLRPVTEVLNIPTELMPLILLRPLSGKADENALDFGQRLGVVCYGALRRIRCGQCNIPIGGNFIVFDGNDVLRGRGVFFGSGV